LNLNAQSTAKSRLENKMTYKDDPENWVTRGKTIKQLIKELQTFDDDNLEVKISIDDGETFKPISIVGRHKGDTKFVHAGLMYCGD